MLVFRIYILMMAIGLFSLPVSADEPYEDVGMTCLAEKNMAYIRPAYWYNEEIPNFQKFDPKLDAKLKGYPGATATRVGRQVNINKECTLSNGDHIQTDTILQNQISASRQCGAAPAANVRVWLNRALVLDESFTQPCGQLVLHSIIADEKKLTICRFQTLVDGHGPVGALPKTSCHVLKRNTLNTKRDQIQFPMPEDDIPPKGMSVEDFVEQAFLNASNPTDPRTANAEAIRWYRVGVKYGHIPSMREYAHRLDRRNTETLIKRFSLFHLILQQLPDDPVARYEIAVMYERELHDWIGIPPYPAMVREFQSIHPYDTEHGWYDYLSVAAEGGHRDAISYLAYSIINRGYALKLSNKEICQQALYWLKKGYKLHDASLALNLAKSYAYGDVGMANYSYVSGFGRPAPESFNRGNCIHQDKDLALKIAGQALEWERGKEYWDSSRPNIREFIKYLNDN